MSTIKDGGPAFICSKCAVSFIPRAWQATSRDYRCLSCKRAQQNERNGREVEAQIACNAYRLADAMLAAREVQS